MFVISLYFSSSWSPLSPQYVRRATIKEKDFMQHSPLQKSGENTRCICHCDHRHNTKEWHAIKNKKINFDC
jgi:hypothetical protein